MKTKLRFSWVIAILLIIGSCSNSDNSIEKMPKDPPVKDEFGSSRSKTFTFSSNGNDIKGKIYLPVAYETNKNLPAIYLLDYKEQHWQVATDENEQVIKGMEKSGYDALVVTLHAHRDIDTDVKTFRESYEIFKNMAAYVDDHYTDNTSRTFIARGSEAGVVLLSLLSEDPESPVFNNFIATDSPGNFNVAVIDSIKNDKIPEGLEGKKLHFSFSSSNDRDNCFALIDAIEDAQYPWLKFESVEYTTDYENTYPTAFDQGLKFALAK